MKKYPKISSIIIGAAARDGYNLTTLAKEIGISYSTLTHLRLPDPGGWQLREWAALKRHVRFYTHELDAISKALEGDLRK